MKRIINFILVFTFSLQLAVSNAAMISVEAQEVHAAKCCDSMEGEAQSCCAPIPEEVSECCFEDGSALPASTLARSGSERASDNIQDSIDSGPSEILVPTHVSEIDPSNQIGVSSKDKQVLFCNFRN